MDFFEAQDKARRKTGRLVALFILAVLSLLALTNVLVAVAFGLFSDQQGEAQALELDWMLFVWISIAVLGVVGFGSLYKTASLSGGGATVADMLQARLIVAGTGDIHEQRVLNIVEEMAIASATPVPPVYLMEEDAINAFAAGFSTSDAVIGVTRGALLKLDRDQLQGVIAHEFSHILNGDMRLNIRLIGLLHGILVLGMMGYYLMRTAGLARRDKNGGALVFLGLGLIVIGAAGTFFGNLIKAAVSRQREYLADASAVQFTRNRDGIAGALKRIGSDSAGSALKHPAAAEVSHALFSEGVPRSFSAMFATHPPLKDRIRALQPDWDGEFSPDASKQTDSPGTTSASMDDSARTRTAGALGIVAAMALQRAGEPDAADMAEARRIHQGLPKTLLDAAHEPHGARALIYCLLLSSPTDVIPDYQVPQGRAAQLDYLRQRADAGVYEALQRLLTETEQLAAEYRLPLVNISLSALRQLSEDQYKKFVDNMAHVMELSDTRRIVPWMFHNLVRHHLGAVFHLHDKEHRGRQKTGSGGVGKPDRESAAVVLLSLLAYLGEQQGVAAAAAFDAGRKVLGDSMPAVKSMPLLAADQLSLAELDKAAACLGQLPAPLKKHVLMAMAACIQADGVMTVAEQELLRTMAEILDCPTPALF